MVVFDYVTGNVVFQGWALDYDQLVAVEMIVDGNYVGQAQYGFPRSDVNAQYPQILGSKNAGWRFTMDTTKLGPLEVSHFRSADDPRIISASSPPSTRKISDVAM